MQKNSNYEFVIYKDIANRTKYAGYLYFLCFMVLSVLTPLWQENKAIVFLFGILLLALSDLRATTSKRINEIDLESFAKWKTNYHMSVLIVSAFWGAYACNEIYFHTDKIFTNYVIFTTAGLCAGSVFSFASHQKLLRTHLFIMLAPVILAFLANGTRASITMAGLSIAFFAFLVKQSSMMTKSSASNAISSDDFDKEMKKIIHEKDQALKQASIRAQFLANMSHEIRTPMNAVLGMASLLSQTKLDPEQKELADNIQESGENLIEIINEILDFSKIEAGAVAVDKHNFVTKEFTKSIVKLFQFRAEKQGIKIKVDIDEDVPQAIYSDSNKIRQILVNFVGNAMKFTKEGSIIIKVSRRSYNYDDLQLHFQIIDTGIGIPKDKLLNLFQDFQQVSHDTARKYGGTGLGLSISKKLIELLGGEVWVTSEVGKGSNFQFLIPVKEVSLNEIQNKEESTEKIEIADEYPLKILVAEDNLVNQKIAKKLLEKMGYQPTIVVDGNEALEAAKTNNYDLILMDLQMPKLSGIEVTKEIYKQMQIDKIPMIYAMTASVLEEDRAQCLEAGMHGFVAKPVVLYSLSKSLQEAYHKSKNLKRSAA